MKYPLTRLFQLLCLWPAAAFSWLTQAERIFAFKDCIQVGKKTVVFAGFGFDSPGMSKILTVLNVAFLWARRY